MNFFVGALESATKLIDEANNKLARNDGNDDGNSDNDDNNDNNNDNKRSSLLNKNNQFIRLERVADDSDDFDDDVVNKNVRNDRSRRDSTSSSGGVGDIINVKVLKGFDVLNKNKSDIDKVVVEHGNNNKDIKAQQHGIESLKKGGYDDATAVADAAKNAAKGIFSLMSSVIKVDSQVINDNGNNSNNNNNDDDDENNNDDENEQLKDEIDNNIKKEDISIISSLNEPSDGDIIKLKKQIEILLGEKESLMEKIKLQDIEITNIQSQKHTNAFDDDLISVASSCANDESLLNSLVNESGGKPNESSEILRTKLISRIRNERKLRQELKILKEQAGVTRNQVLREEEFEKTIKILKQNLEEQRKQSKEEFQNLQNVIKEIEIAKEENEHMLVKEIESVKETNNILLVQIEEFKLENEKKSQHISRLENELKDSNAGNLMLNEKEVQLSELKSKFEAITIEKNEFINKISQIEKSKELEKSNFENEINLLQNKNNHLESQLKNSEAEVNEKNELKSKIVLLENEIIRLSNNDELLSAKIEIQSLQAKFEENEKNLDNITADLKNKENIILDLENNNDLEEKYKLMESDIKSKSELINQLNMEVSNSKLEIKTVQEMCDDFSHKCSQLDKELENYRKIVENLKQDLDEAKQTNNQKIEVSDADLKHQIDMMGKELESKLLIINSLELEFKNKESHYIQTIDELKQKMIELQESGEKILTEFKQNSESEILNIKMENEKLLLKIQSIESGSNQNLADITNQLQEKIIELQEQVSINESKSNIQLNEIEKEKREILSNLDELKLNCNNMKLECENLKKEKEDLMLKIQNLEQGSDQTVIDITNKYELSITELKENESKLNEMEIEKEQIQEELNKFHIKYAPIEQELENHKNEKEDLILKIQNLEQGSDQTVIDITNKYELSIAELHKNAEASENEFKNKLNELEKDIKQDKQKFIEMELKCNSLNSELENSNNENNKLIARIQDIERDSKDIITKMVNEYEETISNLNKTSFNTENELKMKIEEIEKIKASQLKDIESKLLKMNEFKENAIAKENDLKKKIEMIEQQKTKQIQDIETRFTNVKNDLDSTRMKLERKEIEFNELTNQHMKITEKYSTLESTFNELKLSKQNFESELDIKSKELIRINDNLESANQEKKALREAVEKYVIALQQTEQKLIEEQTKSESIDPEQIQKLEVILKSYKEKSKKALEQVKMQGEERIKELEKDLITFKEQFDSKDSTIDSLRQQIAKLIGEKKMQNRHVELERYKQENEKLQTKLNETEIASSEYEDKTSKLDYDLQQCKIANEANQEIITNLQASIDQLVTEKQRLRDISDQREHQLKIINSEMSILKKEELARLELRVQILEDEKENHNHESQLIIEKLQTRLDFVSNERDALRNQVEIQSEQLALGGGETETGMKTRTRRENENRLDIDVESGEKLMINNFDVDDKLEPRNYSKMIRSIMRRTEGKIVLLYAVIIHLLLFLMIIF